MQLLSKPSMLLARFANSERLPEHQRKAAFMVFHGFLKVLRFGVGGSQPIVGSGHQRSRHPVRAGGGERRELKAAFVRGAFDESALHNKPLHRTAFGVR